MNQICVDCHSCWLHVHHGIHLIIDQTKTGSMVHLWVFLCFSMEILTLEVYTFPPSWFSGKWPLWYRKQAMWLLFPHFQTSMMMGGKSSLNTKPVLQNQKTWSKTSYNPVIMTGFHSSISACIPSQNQKKCQVSSSGLKGPSRLTGPFANASGKKSENKLESQWGLLFRKLY